MTLGDPAGIGPELVAKLLAKQNIREKANIVLVADKDELEKGMEIAKAQFVYEEVSFHQLGQYEFKTGVRGSLLAKFHHSC
ncbi:hypothetical protein [Pasteurella multocida]|uniref:hypothetical protein n=1 Tax=Pasteurella multocida TaxID=747 RepID=UPI001E653C10